MKLHNYVLILAIASLPACTWVEPTKESSEVTLVKAFNVKACKKLTTITSTVKHKVGPVIRDEEQVLEELITLAKNRAAALGGDSIVAKETIATDGVMSFDVFKCAE